MTSLPTTVPLNRGDESAAISRTGYAPRSIAVPLLPPDATEAEWLEYRRRNISASEVAIVLGRSPYGSPFSLWWQKQPGWPATTRTMSMHIGLKLEATIADLWEEAHPSAAVYRPGARLFGHPQHDFLTCTPDFLAVFDDAPQRVEPLECKSDEDRWTDVPEHYRWQVWAQCFVLGATLGHVAHLRHKTPTFYEVPFGEEERETFLFAVKNSLTTFYSMLETGVSPSIDSHDETEHTLGRLYADVEPEKEVELPRQLIDDFRYAARDLEIAKREMQLRRNQVRAAMGDARYAVNEYGERVAVRKIYKRKGYEVAPSVVDELRRVGKLDGLS